MAPIPKGSTVAVTGGAGFLRLGSGPRKTRDGVAARLNRLQR